VSGYSSDDSLLGGAMQLDSSIAFVAVTERLGYWRGEVKTIYTGQGWRSAQEGLDSEHVQLSPAEAELNGESFYHEEIFIQDTRLNEQLFRTGEVGSIEEMLDLQGKPFAHAMVTYDPAH